VSGGMIHPVITGDSPPAAPHGWKWRLLGDVARLESGHTPSRREPSYWEGGNIPWLSLKDIRNLDGRYVHSTGDQPTQMGIDNSSARVLPKGTVAFCRTASVGKVVILGKDMATSQDFANWVCGPELLPEYLYEALRASSGMFEIEKQGSTHQTIYMPVLERFRVLVPPLAEQQRIVDMLDKADAIRRKRKEAIALTDELLRSTFLEMFGDPVTNPKGWEVRRLEEVVDLIDYGVTASAVAVAVGPKFLRITDIQENRVEWVSVPYCECDGATAARAMLRPGDIVFARTGATTGKSFLITECPDRAVFASYLIRVRPGPRLLPAFLAEFFQSEAYWSQIRSMAEGAAQPGVNASKLGGLLVPVPPLARQREMARVSETILGMKTRVETAIVDTGQLFESLAHRAFNEGFST